MKKNNKKVVLIISLIIVVGIVVLLYLLLFKKSDNYANGRDLRFYEWADNQYKEYKYTCKKSDCNAKSISDGLYLLNDDKKYMYTPTDNKRTEVNFKSDYVYEVVKDSNEKPFAIVFKENEDYESNKSLYILSENKLYFENSGYNEIYFLKYSEEIPSKDGEESETKEHIISYDYVEAIDDDSNIFVIDYKNNKVLFDSSKLKFQNEEELHLTLNTIRVNDKMYYTIECPEGISYLLNDKFETISSYSSKGQMGQFGAGNQYLIYKNKIYVVNTDNKSFSIYDSNGKLIKKSEIYKNVYCLDAGYALVYMEIDGVNYDVVIDENGKELFKVESDQGDLSVSLYYDEKNNSLIIGYVTGLDSGIDYVYSFKTKQVTKKNYDYMGY